MTARARRHALSRSDENVNEAGRVMIAYANARIARRSTLARVRYVKEKDGEQREIIISREGNYVSRRYSLTQGSVAHESFRVPLKSAAQTRELLTKPRMSAAKQALPYVADFTPWACRASF